MWGTNREPMVRFAKRRNSMPHVENEDSPDPFAKVVFCLDQINFTILDQAFNRMPGYLLIFDKAPPPP